MIDTPPARRAGYPISWSAVAGALAAVGLVIALIALIMVVANEWDVTFGDRSGRRMIYAGLIVTVYAAVQFGALLGALVYFALVSRAAGDQVDPLYRAVLLKAILLFAYLLIAGVRALDRLVHGLRIEWLWAREPEITLAQLVIFALLVVAFGYFLALILRGRRWPTRAVAVFYAVMVASAVAVLIVGGQIGSSGVPLIPGTP